MYALLFLPFRTFQQHSQMKTTKNKPANRLQYEKRSRFFSQSHFEYSWRASNQSIRISNQMYEHMLPDFIQIQMDVSRFCICSYLERYLKLWHIMSVGLFFSLTLETVASHRHTVSLPMEQCSKLFFSLFPFSPSSHDNPINYA